MHEWIAPAGGSENVLEAMSRAFPDAEVQCLWNDAPERFGAARVTETWMARTPLRNHKALAAPVCVPTWRMLPRRDVDWMLISSHLFAHHAHLRGRGPEVEKYVYVHTPARYLWVPEFDPRGQRRTVRAVAPVLRTIDRVRAREPRALAANSAFVRERIRDCWDRDAVVIPPPVDVDRLRDIAGWEGRLTAADRSLRAALPRPFVLGASRFASYKRLDLVIAAAELVGLPAVIAGRGPDEAVLRARAAAASVPVTVVTSPSDALLAALYLDASVFVFPAIEDFGIMPVEAQALGTPVVTGPLGGQTETFLDGVSGIVAAGFDAVDLADAVRRALALPAFAPDEVTAPFSGAVFERRLRDFVGR